jgi:hypothetical protein
MQSTDAKTNVGTARKDSWILPREVHLHLTREDMFNIKEGKRIFELFNTIGKYWRTGTVTHMWIGVDPLTLFYICKGAQKVKFRLQNADDIDDKDEISLYIRGRYLCSMDAVWRILGYQVLLTIDRFNTHCICRHILPPNLLSH